MRTSVQRKRNVQYMYSRFVYSRAACDRTPLHHTWPLSASGSRANSVSASRRTAELAEARRARGEKYGEVPRDSCVTVS